MRVLFVAQTPPPFGGQAIMQQAILDGNYRRVEFIHLRMAFSEEMHVVGKFRFRKLLHLVFTIAKAIYLRLRYHTQTLYYPPSGPNRFPMYRDIAILLASRWLFRWTVFHFHAGGLSELYRQLSRPEQWLFRAAYFQPDVAIELSDLNPGDGVFVNARRVIFLPYGIADHRDELAPRRPRSDRCVLLYVGVIRESKGVLVLLEACRRLKQDNAQFTLRLVGAPESKAFESRIREVVRDGGLTDNVEIVGRLVGNDKWAAYRDADVFCFPSFFESETFGLVVLEAMQFGLPVVATRWRGIPSLIEENRSGFLVDIKNSGALAIRLRRLIENPSLRDAMGRRGRQLYEERYDLERFYAGIEQALLSLSPASGE